MQTLLFIATFHGIPTTTRDRFGIFCNCSVGTSMEELYSRFRLSVNSSLVAPVLLQAIAFLYTVKDRLK